MSLKEPIKQLQKRERITQDELFRRLGYHRSSVIDHTSAEATTAFQFAFGNVTASELSSDQNAEFENVLPWARKFPIRALQKMGHIPTNITENDIALAVFRFMNIGGINGFNNFYNATLHTTNPQTYAAWIRLGELRVKRSTNDFKPDREALFANLKFLRTNSLLHKQDIRRLAREALQSCGIEYIEVEPFLTAPSPTCAFYWRGYRPVVQFTTTKMDDSKFIEALFHAIAHVLMHPLRTSCLQVGNLAQQASTQSNSTIKSIQEIEAEKFAQDMALSEAEECELICCGGFSERRCIQHFSGLFHVRPGILVERLQQQGKISRRTPLNDFKVAV